MKTEREKTKKKESPSFKTDSLIIIIKPNQTVF